MPPPASESANLASLTTEIVAAFVSHNAVPAAKLPALFETIHTALLTIASGVKAPVEQPAPVPAVSIRQSIKPDYLVCLDDGKKFKSLKRHLSTLGMTPEQYRTKWNLPPDYPMVAANYAAQRSELAKKIGLGQFGRNSSKMKRGRPTKKS